MRLLDWRRLDKRDYAVRIGSGAWNYRLTGLRLRKLKSGCGHHDWRPAFVGPFMEFRWECARCPEKTQLRKGFYLP